MPVAADLTPRQLARRFTPDGLPVVVLGHATLGDAPLGDAIGVARLDDCDVTVRGATGEVLVLAPAAKRDAPFTLDAEGWIDTLDTEERAHAVVIQLLSGARRGVEIGASADDAGVYRARGSVVERGAVVIGPCFLGRGSFVAAGARVGPFAVLDAGAIVERGATVETGRVAERTILGAGVTLSSALAEGEHIVRHAGRPVSLGEPLLVARRSDGPSDLGSRAAAALLWLLFSVVAAIGSTRARRAAVFARRAAAHERSVGAHEAAILVGAVAPVDASSEAREIALRVLQAVDRPSRNLRLALSSLRAAPAGVAL
jgi:hypothetical protein